MLQACLNGLRDPRISPGVPVTPGEIADDARDVVAAGAQELHIHPRDAAAVESLAPEDIAACLRAVRAAVPEVPVGVSTGDWIAPGGRLRHAMIAAWEVLPDYASVNLGEPDAPDVIELLGGLGVGVEAGLAEREDALRFVSEIDPAACLRVMIEIPDCPAGMALEKAQQLLEIVDDAQTGLPILLHGEGRGAWACAMRAVELGLDTRIGLEDVAHLPDGRPAPDNAALVAALVALAQTAQAQA